MKGKLYTIAFNLIVCAASALIVTAANTRWKAAYEEHTAAEKQRAVLEALGLVKHGEGDLAALADLFQKHVRTTQQGDLTVYEGTQDGSLLGYAFEVGGAGLQGEIHGVLALEPDKRTIRGLSIYQQQETPGLGGEVASAKFLGQFRGKSVMGAGGKPEIKVIKGARALNEVDAITGATFTSRAVERFLNKDIRGFLAGEKLVQVAFELPERVAVGQFSVPAGSNAEAPSREARPPFFAPGDARNLSRGKPVTASDEEPIVGQIAMVTDGDKKSMDGSYVELGPGVQYVQIDLGETCTIYAVLVWHYYAEPRVCQSVVVQAADDAAFSANVRTLFNNDQDNSAKLGAGQDREYFETYEGKLIPAEGVKARYVRLYSNGSYDDPLDLNRYVEVEVFGRPASGR